MEAKNDKCHLDNVDSTNMSCGQKVKYLRSLLNDRALRLRLRPNSNKPILETDNVIIGKICFICIFSISLSYSQACMYF